MVATRLALLSLAASSNAMFSPFRGDARAGRFDRRADQSNGTAVTTPATPPPIIATAPRPLPSLAAQQLTEGQPEGQTDYPYPPDFAVGSVTTGFSNVPSKMLDPSRASVAPETVVTPMMPPPSEHKPVPSQTDTFTPTITREAMTPDLGRHGDEYEPDHKLETTSILTPPIPAKPSDKPVAKPTDKPLPTQNTLTRTVINGTMPGVTGATPTSGKYTNKTAAWTPITTPGGKPISICQPSDQTKPSTITSTVYTATITWTGERTDYTPQYTEDPTPEPSCVDGKTPVRLTMSRCTSTGSLPGQTTCETTTSVTIAPVVVSPPFADPQRTMAPTTYLTTAKNPAVVYSTSPPPDYGGVPTKQNNRHDSPTAEGVISTPGYHTIPPPPVTLIVHPGGVVIDDHSYADNPGQPTQTVTVDGNTFTIKPNEVVGVGATVARPAAVGGGIFVPTPTSTNLGGLSVVVSSSIAVIDGTTFTIPSQPTTAVIRGQTVSLGPNGIAIASQTIAVTSAPLPSTVLVAGGHLLTAAGQSVVELNGKRITYGPGSSSTVTDIDGDTITIGPSGVVVHGTTLGGAAAKTGDMSYEIVGGATITEIGASIVVIAGHTYTVGPGTPTTTTVVGGETITIGPSGVSISTMTLHYPFGPTTVITPGATAPTATPAPTSSKDAGPSGARPDWFLSLILTCIAIGVRIFGSLL